MGLIIMKKQKKSKKSKSRAKRKINKLKNIVKIDAVTEMRKEVESGNRTVSSMAKDRLSFLLN